MAEKVVWKIKEKCRKKSNKEIRKRIDQNDWCVFFVFHKNEKVKNGLELIDILKDEETYSEEYTDKDGDWIVYDVNGTNIAVQRYERRTTKRYHKKR